jgi:elongation factor P
VKWKVYADQAVPFLNGILVFMAALIDAIDVKRKTRFELDNVPYYCLEAEVNTPTARGGQTLVRLKMRNLVTSAVFDRTFKAGEKFKEPDLQTVSASYLYHDGTAYHFLDQQTFETHSLEGGMMGSAIDYLTEGLIVELLKFNGNPIGVELPSSVTLKVAFTEPGVRGDSSSGGVTKPARLETGLDIRVPPFIKEGEMVKVSTETGEFQGRA